MTKTEIRKQLPYLKFCGLLLCSVLCLMFSLLLLLAARWSSNSVNFHTSTNEQEIYNSKTKQ